MLIIQATEEDKQPNTNIKPFGLCSVLRSSCSPSLIKWDNPLILKLKVKKNY